MRPTEDWGPALPQHWRIIERSTQTGEDYYNATNGEEKVPSYAYDNEAIEIEEKTKF